MQNLHEMSNLFRGKIKIYFKICRLLNKCKMWLRLSTFCAHGNDLDSVVMKVKALYDIVAT